MSPVTRFFIGQAGSGIDLRTGLISRELFRLDDMPMVCYNENKYATKKK